MVIVDDQNLVRAGLRSVLGTAGMSIVGEAISGEDALVRIRELCGGPAEQRPNVVVVEQRIPGLGGIETTRRIKGEWPDLGVILLSRSPDEPGLRAAFDAGATGYALKDAGESELIAAIEAVATGDRYLHPGLGSELPVAVRAGWERPQTGNVSLSEREIDVVRLVVQGYSSKEIASTLFLSIRTVEAHRASIIKKTGIRVRSELLRFAQDAGILESREAGS